MLEQIRLEVDRNAVYSFGRFSIVVGAPGDCSSKLAAIFMRAGIPVRRTKASRMFLGLDGWTHEAEFPFKEAHACDVIIMTLDTKRPKGHAGVASDDTVLGMSLDMAHASSSKGFIAVVVWATNKDYFYPKIDGIFSVRGVDQ